jgi:protein SCO1/2
MMRLVMMMLLSILLSSVTKPASGQVTGSVDSLDGVGINEKLDGQLPLQLAFRDVKGDKVALGELFDGKKPVILSLNYSDCPMLCQLQLNGLIDGLRDVQWNAGEKFQVVSVSINPLETPQRAAQTKLRYVRAYGRPETAAGWHFLTGDRQAIQELADAVGFQFQYVPERQEYAHAAVIMVCTPTGKVSRYLYGVVYPPQTIRLALVEAGEGKIGSTLDRVLLYCFHYDATAGRYAPVAIQMMKVAAAGTLIVLAGGLLPAWLRSRFNDRRRTAMAAGNMVSGGVR